MKEIIKSVTCNQLQLYLRMPFGKRSSHGGQMQPCKTDRCRYFQRSGRTVAADGNRALGLIHRLKNIETVLKELVSVRSEINLPRGAVQKSHPELLFKANQSGTHHRRGQPKIPPGCCQAAKLRYPDKEQKVICFH